MARSGLRGRPPLPPPLHMTGPTHLDPDRRPDGTGGPEVSSAGANRDRLALNSWPASTKPAGVDGPTENLNLKIKNTKRTAHGYGPSAAPDCDYFNHGLVQDQQTTRVRTHDPASLVKRQTRSFCHCTAVATEVCSTRNSRQAQEATLGYGRC